MRIWTIVFAILFAFGAQLNTFGILNQLWTSPEARARLVNDRETILKEASVVLSVQSGSAPSSGPGVPPQILGRAMKALKETEKEAATGLPEAPEKFGNLNEAEDWLRKNAKAEGLKEQLVKKYRDLVLAELSAEAGKIKQDLAEAGFKITFATSWKEFKGMFHPRRNILGILITAGLLSLGAPFWFNMLRSLSNLRPLLANGSTKTATGSA